MQCLDLYFLSDERAALRCYKTSAYKLHYFESPTGIKMLMLTDPATPALQEQLAQIYRDIFIEYGLFHYF